MPVRGSSVSLPISASDIARWAMAVHWPEPPPPRYWAETFVVAPDEFNPFAWVTQRPTPADPHVMQTAFTPLDTQ